MDDIAPDALPPLPLLITGVAGVAGYNAFRYFRERYGPQVVGTRRTDNWPLQREGIVACDCDDRDSLARLFDQHQFASVLNAEGTCKLKSCELDPRMAQRINIDSVNTLLDVIRGTNTRLLHLSIDLVFSGTRGGRHGGRHDRVERSVSRLASAQAAERPEQRRANRLQLLFGHEAEQQTAKFDFDIDFQKLQGA